MPFGCATSVEHIQTRLTECGLSSGDRVPFFLRQRDVADLLGMTQVHVSRILKNLRDKNIVDVSDGVALILDPVRLRLIARF